MLAVIAVGVGGFFIHKNISKGKKPSSNGIGDLSPRGDRQATGLAEATFVESDGYPAGTVVLEVQRPYSRKLVKGEKTTEIRSYPLPKEYIGKTIQILETRPSSSGSVVPDIVDPDDEELGGLYLIGEVIFKQCKQYTSEAEFNSDFNMHQITRDSPFYFSPDKPCYAWAVSKPRERTLADPCPVMRRVERSFFEVLAELPETDNWGKPYEGGFEE